MEEWKRSKMCPDYEVSNYAQVRNIETREIIDPVYYNSPRGKVVLHNDTGKKEQYYLDEIVADAFQDIDHTGLKVIHKNDDRQDNTPDNLKWIDKNKRDKVRCVQTGVIYNDVRQCSEDLDIAVRKIKMCIDSKVLMARSRTTGELYSFEHVD